MTRVAIMEIHTVEAGPELSFLPFPAAVNGPPLFFRLRVFRGFFHPKTCYCTRTSSHTHHIALPPSSSAPLRPFWLSSFLFVKEHTTQRTTGTHPAHTLGVPR